jgi:hypothetical protein
VNQNQNHLNQQIADLSNSNLPISPVNQNQNHLHQQIADLWTREQNNPRPP